MSTQTEDYAIEWDVVTDVDNEVTDAEEVPEPEEQVSHFSMVDVCKSNLKSASDKVKFDLFSVVTQPELEEELGEEKYQHLRLMVRSAEDTLRQAKALLDSHEESE